KLPRDRTGQGILRHPQALLADRSRHQQELEAGRHRTSEVEQASDCRMPLDDRGDKRRRHLSGRRLGVPPLGRFWGGRMVRDRLQLSAGQEGSPRIPECLRTVEDGTSPRGPHGIQEVVGSPPFGSTLPFSPTGTIYVELWPSRSFPQFRSADFSYLARERSGEVAASCPGNLDWRLSAVSSLSRERTRAERAPG